MATTPSWSAATSTAPTLAGQINQFLVAHSATLVYDGTAFSNPGGSISTADNFSTTVTSLIYRFAAPASPTALTRVAFALANVNAGTDVILALQGDNGTRANGTNIVTVTVPAGWLTTSTPTDITPAHGFPLSHTLSSSEFAFYNLVLTPVSGYTYGSSNNLAVYRSSSTSSGTAWTYNANTSTYTAQSYGYWVRMYSGTSGELRCVTEDNGLMLKGYDYNTSGQMSAARQWTSPQSGTAGPSSSRTLTFTNGLLTSVA